MSTPGTILIHRNGQQYGPYTLEQVNNYLASGTLLPTDLAWDGQHADWISLSQLPGVTSVAALPPPPPPPPSGGQRNIALLCVMAFVWWIFFMVFIFFIGCFLAGAIAGATHPANPAEAGREAGRWVGQVLGLPIIAGTLAFSIWLTVIGKLPGTRK